MAEPLRFLKDSLPELIVKEMDFPRHANANTQIGSCYRKRSRCQVGPVAEPFCNLKDAVACRLVDSGPSVERAVHGPNRYLRQFSDAVDSYFLWLHWVARFVNCA